jgi:hypothetical protein
MDFDVSDQRSVVDGWHCAFSRSELRIRAQYDWYDP